MRCAFAFLASLALAGIPFATAEATVFSVKGDANTDTAAPNANLGSNGVLAVANSRVTLLKFAADQVGRQPGDHATLTVVVVLTKSTSNAVVAKLITSPWDEKTVTAATLPSI